MGWNVLILQQWGGGDGEAVSSEGSQSYPRTCQQFAYPGLDTCQLPAQLRLLGAPQYTIQYSECLS